MRLGTPSIAQIRSLVDCGTNGSQEKTNTLRRLLQRTINNEALRNGRNTQYLECKSKYAAMIEGEIRFLEKTGMQDACNYK
jgi:hypothetical protein